MEKLFYVFGPTYKSEDFYNGYYYKNKELDDINEHLNDGWSVKMIITDSINRETSGYGGAYIVLEKK